MGFINRHAFIIAPNDPFHDWVRNIVPQLVSDLPNDPLAHDGASIYLIPEFDAEEEAMEWLEDNFESFFEAELSGWSEDESRWPELTWEHFRKWFYVSYQSMVENTVEGPIWEEED